MQLCSKIVLILYLNQHNDFPLIFPQLSELFQSFHPSQKEEALCILGNTTYPGLFLLPIFLGVQPYLCVNFQKYSGFGSVVISDQRWETASSEDSSLLNWSSGYSHFGSIKT